MDGTGSGWRVFVDERSCLIFKLASCVCRMLFHIFFFSSRRRHTRLQGDWSSDVCSSDLAAGADVTKISSITTLSPATPYFFPPSLPPKKGGEGCYGGTQTRVRPLASIPT